MAPFPLVYGAETYRTSEALFQALRFEDPALQELIRGEKSPMAAKMVAKKHVHLMTVTPQSPQDLQNMRTVLRLKIAQHPHLGDLLLATGNDTLIEDCTARQRGSGLFWGAALGPDGWKGENWLGRLWMELRSELRRQMTT